MSKVKPRPCTVDGCTQVCLKQKRKCGWHWLADQSIDKQEKAAQLRLERAQGREGYVYRARVPRELWPVGSRFCAGCQSFVPLWYVQSSRCLACARRSSRASHVERTYGIAGDEERALRAWQSGRCFICGRRALTRELAVDHDHVSGAVRGLLCSDDEFGCNVLLRRLLGDPGAAERLLAYVTKSPLQRMRDGEEPWQFEKPVEYDDAPPPY